MFDVSPSWLEFCKCSFEFLLRSVSGKSKNMKVKLLFFSPNDECSGKKLSDMTAVKKGVKAREGTNRIKHEQQ